MEEQAAHQLYTEFQAVDAGARFKQGLGFAGRGAPKELQGWADKDDDDVIARNRRLFGGGRGRQEERGSPEYDSDTAEAVQRRLRQLKKEQRPQQAEGPAPLPDRLYDERREQQQARHSQLERAAQEERRHPDDSLRPSDSRQRRRSRSRERWQSRERRRSRSRERRRSRSRDRRRSRSRSAERQRHRGHSDSRHRRRSRSRERERERDRHYRAQRRSRSPRGRDERRVEERGRGSGRPGGGGAPPAAGSGLQKLDFEALIPGYSAMTAPQKLQAKTQYLLERSEAKDRKQQERGRQDEGGAEPQQWTRFKFSDAAELEEHRLQPAAVYGEANEEAEDVAAAGLGGVSAVTFKQSNAAAVQQERDDSHAAAIFGGGGGGGMGPGTGLKGAAAADHGGAARPRQAAAAASGRQQQRAPAEEPGSWRGSGGNGAAGMAGSEEDLLALAEAEGAVVVPAAEVAAVLHQSQSVPAVGGAGSSGGALSWRERALAAKRAKQQQ